jgi:hypothetical protein
MISKQEEVRLRQTSIKDTCDKKVRARTIHYIASFFYQSIVFNVAHLKSFKKMIEAIGRYGSHLKPPSYHDHELRVHYFRKNWTV